jgi:molybdopterin synthase sulfur carrier subunit
MRVHVFAVLKDYFENDFELNEGIGNVTGLKERLIELNPAADSLLDICRFAVKDDFIDNDFQLQEYDTIYIIPPGSGG